MDILPCYCLHFILGDFAFDSLLYILKKPEIENHLLLQVERVYNKSQNIKSAFVEAMDTVELKLQPVLKQQVILSQAMLQSLTILGYSTDELHSLLESKQQKNPFLGVQYKHSAPAEFYSNIEDTAIDFTQGILEQLLHLDVSKRLTYITKLVLADLSETGFLTQSPNEMAVNFRASLEEIQQALFLLRQCEPEGLGCANLQEFLVRQAECCPAKVKDVLKNYYDLFLNQRWHELTRQSGYSGEEIREVCTYVAKMKTRPLSGVLNENVLIRPDVSVTVRDGKIRSKFYEHAFPQTFFDCEFGDGLEESIEVQQYLRGHYEEVKVLKEQLEIRKETIRKITEEIIERQEGFFSKGPEFLKSLTMTEISQKLDVHVSTVSRAVREKYISTPYGTFAFRHFFTKSNQFLDESKMTVNQLKKYILTSIRTEDSRKPISDQEIVNRLKEQGIVLSRRVITKYREQLNVPASFKRKQLSRLQSGC